MTGDGRNGRLDDVQAYYDRLAPRLVEVESRNWHLQSRMALNLETIDEHFAPNRPRNADSRSAEGPSTERPAPHDADSRSAETTSTERPAPHDADSRSAETTSTERPAPHDADSRSAEGTSGMDAAILPPGEAAPEPIGIEPLPPGEAAPEPIGIQPLPPAEAPPEQIASGPNVLDIGCGTGFLLERLAERGFRGVGIDLSPESVELAQRRLAEIGAADRLRAEVGSAYDPPEGPFDLIALTDVLEHLEDPRACLIALRRVLAPGGLLVISTPNRRSLPGARRWLAERGVPGIRLNLAPIDNWQTWTDLESHAAAAGLVAVSRRGIFFRPGGRVGSQIGRLYRFAGPRRAELAASRTPIGRFGFYICLGFRAL